MAEEHPSQQPYFEPGVVIGGQRFGRLNLLNGRRLAKQQNNAALKNDVPLHASTYLQDKADARPTQHAALSYDHRHPSLLFPLRYLCLFLLQYLHGRNRSAMKGQSAFALRLRKLLPIIVVVLFLLGLLGALLSSVFFPSSGPGADIHIAPVLTER